MVHSQIFFLKALSNFIHSEKQSQSTRHLLLVVEASSTISNLEAYYSRITKLLLFFYSPVGPDRCGNFFPFFNQLFPLSSLLSPLSSHILKLSLLSTFISPSSLSFFSSLILNLLCQPQVTAVLLISLSLCACGNVCNNGWLILIGCDGFVILVGCGGGFVPVVGCGGVSCGGVPVSWVGVAVSCLFCISLYLYCWFFFNVILIFVYIILMYKIEK